MTGYLGHGKMFGSLWNVWVMVECLGRYGMFGSWLDVSVIV